MSVLDREVNCRRAASAAFQEHVGRQGTFPHGIEIITAADFFALGNRARAYLDIAPKIATCGSFSLFVLGSVIGLTELSCFVRFDEYREAIIDSLLATKVNHWDESVRALSSQSLSRLAPLAVGYMRELVLPQLLQQCTSEDLYERHGSVLALAEIVRALGATHLPSLSQVLSYYKK